MFYTIATSRGADVLRHLLGTAFAGVLGSDRLSTYLTYPAAIANSVGRISGAIS